MLSNPSGNDMKNKGNTAFKQWGNGFKECECAVYLSSRRRRRQRRPQISGDCSERVRHWRFFSPLPYSALLLLLAPSCSLGPHSADDALMKRQRKQRFPRSSTVCFVGGKCADDDAIQKRMRNARSQSGLIELNDFLRSLSD